MKFPRLLWTSAFLLLWSAIHCSGQTALFDTNSFVPAGSADPSFTLQRFVTPEGLTFNPIASQIQPDGKLLLSGYSVSTQTIGTNLVNTEYPDLIRLNADGSLDVGFIPRIDQTPTSGCDYNAVDPPALSVQPDGGILFLGCFRSVEQQPRAQFARLHPDGSLDRSFDPKLGSPPQRLLLQSDGRIIVGRFDGALGQSGFLLERFNPDGSRDPSFSVRLDSSGGRPGIAIQSDDKVLVRGQFSKVNNGVLLRNLVRLNRNGSIDESFVVSPLVQDRLSPYDYLRRQVAVGRDGRILVLGYRSGSTPQAGEPTILCLRPDGSLDFTAQGAYNGGPLFEQADGKWLVLFVDPPARLLRMNPDGTPDTAWNSSDVQFVALQADQKILVTWLGKPYRLLPDAQHFSFQSMTRISPTQLKFVFNSSLSRPHVLEVSSDLKHWSFVAQALGSDVQPTVDFTDWNAPATGARFYRVRRE